MAPSLDANVIETQLKQRAAFVTEKTLGPPNAALSNSNEWRYGIRGDFVVYVHGKHQGSFHNKLTGETGDMTTLLMKSMNVSAQDALVCGLSTISKLPAQELNSGRSKNIQIDREIF